MQSHTRTRTHARTPCVLGRKRAHTRAHTRARVQPDTGTHERERYTQARMRVCAHTQAHPQGSCSPTVSRRPCGVATWRGRMQAGRPFLSLAELRRHLPALLPPRSLGRAHSPGHWQDDTAASFDGTDGDGRRTRTGATSASGLGSAAPHLRRGWAHPAHICAGTGLAPPTSAPGLGSPHRHLHRDWAHTAHICTGTGLGAANGPVPVARCGRNPGWIITDLHHELWRESYSTG